MAEYIPRETAKEELLSWARCINHPEHLMTEDAMCILDNIPAADVVPVVHGRWEFDKVEIEVYCSVCGHNAPVGMSSYIRHKYCPHCGARMDGE